ncbi:hypothetical protein G7Y89_g10124 [Cudoniella acicularis]|uniref:DNA (cytosine-5-)-methyltransferase n=1 Tax=Cudoniella acicularis TaxID=354080 RepID=A0A8H4RDC7_9HELO|nr:hypothetical protein G7Y89_g10124 [Cudoniella acicularis]
MAEREDNSSESESGLEELATPCSHTLTSKNTSLIGLTSPSLSEESSHATEAPDDSASIDDTDINGVETENMESMVLENNINETKDLPANPAQKLSLTSVCPTDFVYPKSQYNGYTPPLPISKERVAMQDLIREVRNLKKTNVEAQKEGSPESSASSDKDDEEIKLSQFSIYLPPTNKLYSYQLRSLQNLFTKTGVSSYLFDGILSVGNVRHYVQAVPFKICSIGNYGEDLHDYRLREPAPEYVRFHKGFQWLSNLAKHFVDYSQTREKENVSIFKFRSEFSEWMKRNHWESPAFQSWFQEYGKDDFRPAIAANIHFLFKESIGVDENLRSHSIWHELMDKDFVKKEPIVEGETIVTPYIYECFRDLNFGPHMKCFHPNPETSSHNIGTKDLNQKPATPPRAPDVEIPAKRTEVRIGDVLAVTKDGEGSVWKDEISKYKAADTCWYVYVQGIHEPATPDDQRSFDGLWLYRPSDTSCAKMRYPFSNELFLSDNCTCNRGRISQDEVIDIVSVMWACGPPKSSTQLFIRQTNLENERFVTLKDPHKKCIHLQTPKDCAKREFEDRYPPGQTILVLPPRRKKNTLEPFEVVKHSSEDGKEYVTLKRLLRRQQIDGKGRPNELVYTSKTEKVPAKKLDRKCLVRFYSEADVTSNKIPVPYNRDGTGNCFYITTRLVESEAGEKLEPIENDFPRSLIQGFDPLNKPDRKPLRGMDLYCGGGNFGRGLEEGGAVQFKYAVDIYDAAIHTYHANQEVPGITKMFFGSVNDLLVQAMQGNPHNSDSIPVPGDIDFISAGSPCQGFSVLNSARNNEKGLRNQSLVASVAAYVDVYRPKYGVLENVMNMAQKGRRRDEDVLSQLICAIVGMGYQLQIFVLDAWSCGSPQSRSRLFVCFAVPGLTPLTGPGLSHSHHPMISGRGLGKLANGESFGHRQFGPTPFEWISAQEATKDLPSIGDGHTYQCTPFPYYVSASGITKMVKSQIEAIPKQPRGMNFAKAWNEGKGVMTQKERALFPPEIGGGKVQEVVSRKSHAWGRANPASLFPTTITKAAPSDSRMGTCLHWDDNRPLTVAEAQRSQSYPDNEVLVGSVSDQWKILGNSVPRTISMALGLQLREAWLANLSDAIPKSAIMSESLPAGVPKVQSPAEALSLPKEFLEKVIAPETSTHLPDRVPKAQETVKTLTAQEDPRTQVQPTSPQNNERLPTRGPRAQAPVEIWIASKVSQAPGQFASSQNSERLPAELPKVKSPIEISKAQKDVLKKVITPENSTRVSTVQGPVEASKVQRDLKGKFTFNQDRNSSPAGVPKTQRPVEKMKRDSDGKFTFNEDRADLAPETPKDQRPVETIKRDSKGKFTFHENGSGISKVQAYVEIPKVQANPLGKSTSPRSQPVIVISDSDDSDGDLEDGPHNSGSLSLRNSTSYEPVSFSTGKKPSDSFQTASDVLKQVREKSKTRMRSSPTHLDGNSSSSSRESLKRPFEMIEETRILPGKKNINSQTISTTLDENGQESHQPKTAILTSLSGESRVFPPKFKNGVVSANGTSSLVIISDGDSRPSMSRNTSRKMRVVPTSRHSLPSANTMQLGKESGARPQKARTLLGFEGDKNENSSEVMSPFSKSKPKDMTDDSDVQFLGSARKKKTPKRLSLNQSQRIVSESPTNTKARPVVTEAASMDGHIDEPSSMFITESDSDSDSDSTGDEVLQPMTLPAPPNSARQRRTQTESESDSSSDISVSPSSFASPDHYKRSQERTIHAPTKGEGSGQA